MARGTWFRAHRKAGTAGSSVPDGLWSLCPRCNEVSFARDVDNNYGVCPKCDYHHPLAALRRIELVADAGTFVEHDPDLVSVPTHGFTDYTAKIETSRRKTNLNDAIVTGDAEIDAVPVVIGVGEFAFMGGSMGGVVGEKIVRAMERGLERHVPVIMFAASGGARMQEGLLALMQMAKTSAAVARLDRAGVPYIVVLTHPTVGGVFASYASLGDVVLAEPGVTVGLAGRRVGNQDIGAKLPDDFQTAEFQLRCGMVDRIVARKELRPTLSKLLSFFVGGNQ